MSFIERVGKRIEQQREMQVFYTEIFYSAKDLLERQGELVVDDFSRRRRRVFKHIEHVRRQDVHIEISSEGADLEKEIKMFVKIQGVGMLELRKKGLRGEEEFKGIEWNEGFEPNFFFLEEQS